HRELRRRARLRSVLDDIDGVGPVRRRAMLRHFGSLKRIREATTDEIAAVKGLNRELATEIRRHLDEMTALLDVEESADSADQPALPLASSAISANNAGARVNDIPAQD
ncbi:helix-hairpin-helix domain-containing protein, partial [Candidatus Binatus sp.]|uniref:helix-hairpin-helix domain-containing protein n=1 Tax=Candidatus Binatus sp. TaxID=2811406 RepID=UPI002FD9D526